MERDEGPIDDIDQQEIDAEKRLRISEDFREVMSQLDNVEDFIDGQEMAAFEKAQLVERLRSLLAKLEK